MYVCGKGHMEGKYASMCYLDDTQSLIDGAVSRREVVAEHQKEA